MANIPKITVKDGILTISITAKELKFVTEKKMYSKYKVLDEDMFLNHFAANLEEFAKSNAVEVGMTELQVLFDEVVDETYTNGSKAIIDEGD